MRIGDTSYEDLCRVPLGLRSPSWRFREAVRLTTNPAIPEIGAFFDEDVRAFYRFQNRLIEGAANSPIYRSVDMHTAEAFRMHTSVHPNGGLRWQIEAMLMTKATDEEVGERFLLNGGAATVNKYRQMFFDIEAYRDYPHNVLANIYPLFLLYL